VIAEMYMNAVWSETRGRLLIVRDDHDRTGFQPDQPCSILRLVIGSSAEVGSSNDHFRASARSYAMNKRRCWVVPESPSASRLSAYPGFVPHRGLAQRLFNASGYWSISARQFS
jgi:hypothetical protein